MGLTLAKDVRRFADKARNYAAHFAFIDYIFGTAVKPDCRFPGKYRPLTSASSFSRSPERADGESTSQLSLIQCRECGCSALDEHVHSEGPCGADEPDREIGAGVIAGAAVQIDHEEALARQVPGVRRE